MNDPNHSRTLAARLFASALLLASAGSALAAVRYVDVNSTNAAPPYSSWATAATNIQDAVDAAVAGDEIVATNGIYATGGRVDGFTTTNRVMVDKPIRLRSVNGPQFTIIDGEGSVRCVYLTNEASLSGFTLTNGLAGRFFTSPIVDGVGAGVRCAAQSAVVSNCVIAGNVARNNGTGGGAYGGTLNNCTLIGNSAYGDCFCARPASDGGGAAMCILNNCTLTNNSAAAGGGASGSTLNNCTLSGNSGGGAVGGILNNCTLTGNSRGGTVNSTLNNCTLTGNFGSGASGGVLNNCTLASNSGGGVSSFVEEGDIYPTTLNNCIIYFNNGANYDPSCTLNYSCTTPLPTNGVGNITNAPLFVNFAAGNYRLRPDSPCIDAGTNLSVSITNDLDGRPRPLDGNGDGLAAFDMGAYEYRTPLLVWQDSPNPTPPHADWATAAHTIQDAVDAAVAGDEIVVTNGTYASGWRAVYGTPNRVAVDKPLTLRSINGPQSTTIDGSGSVRCVYLTDGTSLSGFALTNGTVFWPAYGGGMWCESANAVVSNCVVSGNRTTSFNPENIPVGGGTYGGTLNDCTLSNNYAYFVWNSLGFGSGGGAFNATLNNCTLSGNHSAFGGGASSCVLNKCMLTGNSARSGGGGAVGCTLNNCALSGNSASGRQSSGGGASGCALNNCTLAGNSAFYDGGGAAGCTLNNCIVYFNTAPQAANYNESYLEYAAPSILNNSCTTPLPTNGVGNITNAPLFVDQTSGNLRLQSNSPCINAGLNAFVPAGPDLDGNPRIVGYTVDMGAYESQSAPSIAPQLSITSSGTNVILAWPTNYAEVVIHEDQYEAYFLRATTNLVSPVVWRFVYPMPVVINGRLVVTNTIDGTQRFYRLVKVSGPLGDVPCLRGGPEPCPCYECISGVWTQFGNCRFCDEF